MPTDDTFVDRDAGPSGPTRDAVSTRVVDAVADAAGVGQADLSPLHEAVDPEALNELCAHDGTLVAVSFTYEGYLVTVGGDEDVSLRPVD